MGVLLAGRARGAGLGRGLRAACGAVALFALAARADLPEQTCRTSESAECYPTAWQYGCDVGWALSVS